MDDDILAIDSPLELAVDIDSEEEEDLESDAFALDNGDGAGFPSTAASSSTALLSTARDDKDNPATSLLRRRMKMAEDRTKMLDYPQSLPYKTESLDHMDALLDEIICKLVESVRAKDWDVGFVQWNHKLQCWLALKYPMMRTRRAALARLYYEISVLPGMEARLVELAANMCMNLIESKKKITIKDLTLPWRPLYTILEKELFPKQRKTGHTNISNTLLNLCEFAQRFFPPSETDDMLETFLPRMDGSSLDSVLATQAFLVQFLPLSHPQKWLPAIFRLWESFNSSIFDDNMLDLLARLAELHVDPRVSSAATFASTTASSRSVSPLPKEEKAAGDHVDVDGGTTGHDEQRGLWKDVGIFTDEQFAFVMSKALRSMGIPVGTSRHASSNMVAQGASIRTGADAAASDTSLAMKKPTERAHSLAIVIAYSISEDAPTVSQGSSGPFSTPSEEQPSSKTVSSEPSSSFSSHAIAGSKALAHIAKFIQATETYFHPSNWGVWQGQLVRFVQNLTWEFLKRWKEEEKPDCKTPASRRLTLGIKREFVSIVRTVCLLSMFSKDPMSVAASQSSLKSLAVLEPDLILPAVLERSFPSLEALETTQRTTAIITAISTLSLPLVSREIWRPGAKHLTQLLELTIPGIDLNDPMKTMSTAMFVLLSTLTVKIDDLSRAETQDTSVSGTATPYSRIAGQGGLGATFAGGGGLGAEVEKKLTDEEEDALVRASTSAFEDWVVKFFRRIVALFENLPDEGGKSGRPGGKTEEQVVNTVLAAADIVCQELSQPLFDLSFKVVAEYCTSTVRSNVVRSIGSLVSCFARADPRQTLAKLFPVCAMNIRSELEHGASSVPTTQTSVPAQSDTTLHWNLSVLHGALSQGGEELLEYKDEIIDLLLFVIDRAKTERGWSMCAKMLFRVLNNTTTVYPRESRFVNLDEWNDPVFNKRHHLYWGKMYEVRDVKLDWHVPSQAETDFAIEIIRRIGGPSLAKLNELHSDERGTVRDKIWANEFCRHLTVLKNIFGATPSLIVEDEKGKGVFATDTCDDPPEFLEPRHRFHSGFVLEDRADPRYQEVARFHREFGETLLRAAGSTQETGGEDQIDCTKLLVRSIRTYMTSYSYDSVEYRANSKNLGFFRNITRLWAKQKVYPRLIWVRRAAFHHNTRARLNAFYRRRSPLDDKLIHHLVEFSLSKYVGLRRTAQTSLDTVASFYDGTKAMTMDKLFDALKPGNDPDRMKGALYVLGSKAYCNFAVVDSRFTAPYITSLLQTQHQPKPSIQKIVRTVVNDFIIRLSEPWTIRSHITSAGLESAATALIFEVEESGRTSPTSPELFQQLRAHVMKRESRLDSECTALSSRVLEIAKSDSTHWQYSIFCLRLLRAILRRDRPIDKEVATYFFEQVVSENIKMRRYAQPAVTKMLHFIKLRTLCKTEKDLLLSQTSNPLKHKWILPRPLPPDFTEKYLAGFRQGLDEADRFFDKNSSGWLVWADEVDYYEKAHEYLVWDPSSQGALEAGHLLVNSEDWWSAFMRHLAQEKDRNYLSAETINLVKSIFQVYGDPVVNLVRDRTVEYIGEKDRHKHRAAAEILSSCCRGSKHWPIEKQKELWSWITPVLPKIFQACTPDSAPAWQMCVEYICQQRDPRRVQPIVNYVVEKGLSLSDGGGGSPWEQAKAQNLLRGAALSLSWKFEAWSEPFIELYENCFDHDFAEVRSIVADNLTDLQLTKVHPSFDTVDSFLAACGHGSGSLFTRPQLYDGFVARLSSNLEAWRKERVPTSQAVSRYDKAALTTLHWINTTLSDHVQSAMPQEVIGLLPAILQMVEMVDNLELSRTAVAVLGKISTTPFPPDQVAWLIETLISIINAPDSTWRMRLDVLPILQVVFYQQLFFLKDFLISKIIDVLVSLLEDKRVEVREMAAMTLSGCVKVLRGDLITRFRELFARTLHDTKLPRRNTTAYQDKLLKIHSAILGCGAIIDAFPYEVPEWMPAFITDTISEYTSHPEPILKTVKQCAANFKKNHYDNWAEDERKFDPEQLMALNDWVIGRSDYFA